MGKGRKGGGMVTSHSRRLKSGKVVTVRQYTKGQHLSPLAKAMSKGGSKGMSPKHKDFVKKNKHLFAKQDFLKRMGVPSKGDISPLAAAYKKAYPNDPIKSSVGKGGKTKAKRGKVVKVTKNKGKVPNGKKGSKTDRRVGTLKKRMKAHKAKTAKKPKEAKVPKGLKKKLSREASYKRTGRSGTNFFARNFVNEKGNTISSMRQALKYGSNMSKQYGSGQGGDMIRTIRKGKMSRSKYIHAK